MYCRFLLAIAPTRILELTAAVCVLGLGAPRDGVDDVHTARNNGQRKWRKPVRPLLTTVNAFARSACTTLVRGGYLFDRPALHPQSTTLLRKPLHI
jgi:hypothetical protein